MPRYPCSVRGFGIAMASDEKMYKEYQPIAESLDLVWRYDPRIFGKRGRDWIPYILPEGFYDWYKLN